MSRTRWRSPKTTTCSRISRRQFPIQRSAVPFCQGLRNEVRTGSMPSALTNRTTAGLKIESRSKIRYLGALSYGNALRSCYITHAAVGLNVALK